MGGLLALVKWLVDARVLQHTPGYAALIALGYLYFFQVQPLSAEVADVKQTVEDIRVGQLESKLQEAYTALCMAPGDFALNTLITELEKQYRELTKRNYEARACDLLLKLK